ncbi:MAG TPA: DUF885 domain-containing protein [Thermoanaerobaculia bacterium]|nr:DUF885 domain-containing protein [Thermoanaerobaculia bacterium]
MKKLLVVAVLSVAAVLLAQTPSAKPATAPSGSDPGFAKFVDDYFAARFAARPTEGTAAGLHEYDSRMPDVSRAAIDARIATLKGQLRALLALDRTKLAFDDLIDATALDGEIRSELLDLETLRTWENNPMRYAAIAGFAVNDLMKRDFAPASDRLRSVTARLKAVPAICAAGKANVKNPPKEFTTLATRMSKGSVGFLGGAVADFAKKAAGSDAALLKEFTDAQGKAAAALSDYATWLEKDLAPRSNGSYAIGAANFSAKLLFDDMVQTPLSEVLATGEADLEKNYAAFVETARKIDPSKTPAEVMKSLSNDHPTAQDLIPSVQKSVEAARKFLVDKHIVTIPSEVRPIVTETPPFARFGSFASMDTPGPYETKATEAFYYVTPVEKDWDAKHQEEHLRLFNPYVVDLIDVHEVWPGHYLQFLYVKRFPTKTRQLIACGTNVEGWAHYTEQMMVDEGFGGGDPKVRLAQLQEALLRDCRYVVGIKEHTQGMTVEDGAKVFVEKGFQEPANAYEEARRGAYNPTYLYYTLGKLEILKLREEYRKAKGGSLQAFHDAFVSQGGLPIPLVRRILFR